ncbi:MAG: motility protein A [Bdellovibrionales bacterium]
MNSSKFGLLLALGVFLLIALTSTKDPTVFLDWHAAVIVIGGTLAAALLSFSLGKMGQLFKVFSVKVLKGTEESYAEIVNEIVELSQGHRSDSNYLAANIENIKHPFLKEGIQLMLDGGLTEKEIDALLMKRAKTHHIRYEEDAHMFTTLAKFPPAFGLLGAVVGIVSLMQGLGGADAIKTVGPAMATALIATLYGIAVANFIFIPIGENLSKFNRQDKIIRQMILDGLKMIRTKKHPLLVGESVRSYLLPGERMIAQNPAAKKAA